ncbi:MAG TPA: MucB/RseB C-terminal domain-containing protein [Pseudomonadota bacterium]|nr:MucB/RseB C-terminal domain-containing protein [Xanthomonadales bacterium]HQW63424.1 MucB/RseB C-terminal domain-containing protein [Pseudomonadota bacterium]MBP6691706.1 MucB/RseB C-terminal domain-containing protein [Xanthomonadales bacterium]HQX24511.1 MucB/RseB C-terminal domain-containing protein [Pseudomonadota bacterium]HQY35479.1 MucB/RseB C-terminal domain-containing protein [Pseudomonadota bacterium]
MRFPRRLAVVAWALCAAFAAHAADDPASLLQRAAAAFGNLQYQGTFVYLHDGRLDAMRVTRSVGPEGSVERLVALTGERRELVRDASGTRCTVGGGSMTLAEAGRVALPAPDLQRLADPESPYLIAVVGRDRVAGHDALVLDARPRDAARYGYRLWIEPQSGMLLGSTLVGPTGAAVEQIMFVDLVLQPAAANAAPVPVAAQAAAAAEAADDAGWTVGDLPAGFRLVGRAADSAPGAQHLLYSDGLASVSVYVEPLGNAPVGSHRRGALSVYGRTLDQHQVVVVGDVPPATVERIARSVATPPD